MTIGIVTAPRASTLIYGLAKAGPLGIWLLPANVCPAVPLALMQAKVLFEFVDIDRRTLCLDVKKAEERICQAHRRSIAGIIYVRSYGFAPTADKDLSRLRASMATDSLLIDDQCLGEPMVDWQGRKMPADATLFSTGIGKIVDRGSGGYGLFATPLAYSPPENPPAPDASEQVMNLYKRAIEEDAPIFGGSGIEHIIPNWVPAGTGPSWDELKSDILERIPEVFARKAEINAVYRAGLSDFNCFADGYQNWRFNIRVKNPKVVLAALFDAGLFASDHYYPLSRLWGDLSAMCAADVHASVINLFNDQNFSVRQAEQAVRIIKRVVQR